MFDESKTGMSWLGVLFVIVIVYFVFCNGGGLFGNNCNSGCNRVSNCEVEKQGIIDSATTRYLVEQQGAQTREALRNTQDVITGQASRIYEQGLQQALFDAKMRIQQLEGNAFTKEQTDGIAKALADCCCGFNRRIDAIEAMMLKQPPFYPAGNTFQGFNGCNYGCNNL